MKRIYFLLVSLLLVISSVSFSQDFPTIGEIYDYEIGDEFHTTITEISDWGGGYSTQQNIEIVEKYFSENNDTVFYVQSIVGFTSGVDNPEGEYFEDLETIFYTNLSENFIGDSLFQLPELYNNRLVVQTFDVMSNETLTKRYAVGCGEVYMIWYAFNGGFSGHAQFDLLYFKKGDEEWGEEQTIVGINKLSQRTELKIFPNPASDYINISTIENSEIQIYNSTGQLVLSQYVSPVNNQLDISVFPAGVYFVNIINKNAQVLSKSKFLKL